ncbi:MAG: hypothetical protein C0592_07120 [Marinilabiliales bacterium]|nr:MAG: hypothetical protein C0592_07120 [Marinilabiliales bacterium]
MRKNKVLYSIIISFICFSNSAVSQNIEKLKTDNGFSIFHFGDSLDVYDSDMTLIMDMKTKTMFNYSGHDSIVYFLADLYVDGIFLLFDQSEKLVEFTYYKYYSSEHDGYIEWSEDEFDAMLKYFEFLYGNATEHKYKFSYKWQIDEYQLDLHIVSGAEDDWRRVEAVFSKGD